jgi:hypothetical protein
MFVTQSVAAHGYDAGEWDVEFLAGGRYARDQPGYFGRVGEAEDEFVDYAVDADGARDEGEGSIWWV